jgi:hypothetical protein
MLILHKATLISFVSPLERRFGVLEKSKQTDIYFKAMTAYKVLAEKRNISVDVKSRASRVPLTSHIGAMLKFALCSERSNESHRKIPIERTGEDTP